MLKDTVASSTWSVGRQTLAAFVGIAMAVLLAPAAIYLAATHSVDANRQLRHSTDGVNAYENLESSFLVLSALPQSAGDAGNPMLNNGAAAELERSLAKLEDHPHAAVEEHEQLKELRTSIANSLGTRSAAALASVSMSIKQSLRAAKQLRDERSTSAERAALALYITIGIAAALMLAALAWLLTCIRRDLMERQWFDVQLQDANRLLESLFENMPAMVFAKDARDLRFVRINRAAEKIIGYPREQLLGRNDYDFFPKEQADHFTEKDRETLARGDIVEIPQEQIDTGDHGRRTLHTFKVPIRDKNGRPSLLLGISLDITQEKEAERRIVSLNEELIRQARLLQSSNEELESFCYSVSHDLRAPLRAINGYAQLLEQEYGARFDEQGTRYLRTICNACNRMAQLIDDLLEFSRIGRQTLERESIDMESLVRRALNDALDGRTMPLPMVETGTLPPADGDRTLLQLVWLNLIDNAVKYTGGVASARIKIEAERNANEVIYSVKDNGVGFDMQYADKLFGVFQRLHSNGQYPGTGVGLAIAHRIVLRHGGRIWAKSEPGQGSTFSFALPVAS